MQKNQDGFSAVAILFVVITLVLIGSIGWFIIAQQSQRTQKETAQSTLSEEEITKKNDRKASLITNDYFTLTLPDGFRETTERIFTFTGPPEKNFSYKNNESGDYFEINFNPAHSGINPDFTWYFTANDSAITLEKPTTAVCNPSDDEWCTTADNGRLDSYISGKGAVNYYFTFGNTKSETGNDLTFVDKFIENLLIK